MDPKSYLEKIAGAAERKGQLLHRFDYSEVRGNGLWKSHADEWFGEHPERNHTVRLLLADETGDEGDFVIIRRIPVYFKPGGDLISAIIPLYCKARDYEYPKDDEKTLSRLWDEIASRALGVSVSDLKMPGKFDVPGKDDPKEIDGEDWTTL